MFSYFIALHLFFLNLIHPTLHTPKIIGDLIWENVCKNCNWLDLDTLPIFVGRDQKRDLWM